ncbi:NUDIX domain-containing protein [Streptomyces erythrochromogenes]|uniref:NUDIX domain-containing protein n=1 Tax=Streptomyces erythrochromogenes TaxID=285574 RepID=UPI0036CB1D8A
MAGSFPCGTVDHGEDPETCARREIAEETGLDQPMHGILTVTWSPAGPRLGSPAINLVFDAGTVPASTPILLPEHELEAHRRAYPAEAEQLLLPSGALRLRAALRARETGTVQMLRSSGRLLTTHLRGTRCPRGPPSPTAPTPPTRPTSTSSPARATSS